MSFLQCLSCDHYQFSRKCHAFPEGIPTEIYSGYIDHNDPFQGDRGITFKELEINTPVTEYVPWPREIKLHTKIFEDATRYEAVFDTKTKRLKSSLTVPLPPQFWVKRRGRPKKPKKGAE